MYVGKYMCHKHDTEPSPKSRRWRTIRRPAALLPPSLGPHLRAGLVLFSGLLALPWNALAQSLTVSSWGGLYGQSQRKAYFEPFTAATGIDVVEDDWGGDLAKIRAMVTNGRYQSHVVDAESSDVVEGCAEGIFEPIDYARLGLSPRDMLPGAAIECGVGNVAWSMVLVFDHSRLSDGGPEGWTDFFDPVRFPGGRGLRRGALGNLEIALMADGVAPEDVYALLRTPAGTDAYSRPSASSAGRSRSSGAGRSSTTATGSFRRAIPGPTLPTGSLRLPPGPIGRQSRHGIFRTGRCARRRSTMSIRALAGTCLPRRRIWTPGSSLTRASGSNAARHWYDGSIR